MWRPIALVQYSQGPTPRYKTESIREKAIVYLDPVTGSILYEMGSNHFYMPHGVYLDQQVHTHNVCNPCMSYTHTG